MRQPPPPARCQGELNGNLVRIQLHSVEVHFCLGRGKDLIASARAGVASRYFLTPVINAPA